MPVATFSTSDLSRRAGDVIAEALRGPVTLTQHKKPRLVLLSVAEYDRLRRVGDTREAFTLETAPPDVAAALEAAADGMEDDAP